MTGIEDLEIQKRAKNRFIILNVVRIGSLLTVMAGIAGTQNALPIPYAISVILAFAGFIGFFFGPPHFAKRFKQADAKEGE